ncbi:hypothetical protein V6N13_015952 [Hibiscus sabdariffa]
MRFLTWNVKGFGASTKVLAIRCCGRSLRWSVSFWDKSKLKKFERSLEELFVEVCETFVVKVKILEKKFNKLEVEWNAVV